MTCAGLAGTSPVSAQSRDPGNVRPRTLAIMPARVGVTPDAGLRRLDENPEPSLAHARQPVDAEAAAFALRASCFIFSSSTGTILVIVQRW